jgi:hypothetical protein
MRRVIGVAVCLSLVAIGYVPESLSGLQDDPNTKLSDTVETGLQTDEDALEETDLGPYGFRVEWIEWDSGFRGTDLQIGDRIVGFDDLRYDRSTRKEMIHQSIGGSAEAQYWEKRGARDGTRVVLHVWRKGKSLSIEGPLRAERFYYSGDQKRAIAPGGPDTIRTDGFSSSWPSWYERRVADAVRVLDRGFRQGSFDSRMLLAAHIDEKPRVDYLVEHYPGPFAEQVRQDWQRVHDVLLGPEREFTDQDLEYRSLGERRAAAIKAIADDARRRFLAEHETQTVAAFPAIDPIAGDLARVTGKVVVLPELDSRSWISEAGHGYLVAGDRQRGLYFVDSRSEPMMRVLMAQLRYHELVSPELDETYLVIGRIRPAPMMRIVSGNAASGLEVEVIASTVGGAMFVDAQVLEGGKSPFAGQESLSFLGVTAPDPDASPSQVVDAAMTALKVGDQKAWGVLFASWYLSDYGNGRVFFGADYYRQPPHDDWVRARRQVLGDVYDINVVDEGLVQRVLTGKEFRGAPVVDQVEVEVEHIGKFPEGYRHFTNVNVRRVWQLQRVDGGPWRITSRRAL